ncbi:PfkB family carbohydrate kinase [Malaciobacter mytili]|uniref:ADP-heptose synthase n=1 Tax=Malaciobacter mytili LMG 24559 TaxID=1032238 RepID=A0AAX2ALV3_9BACT|nr:PfkB family carbohydrate kinase [Malaciobacter mytili]AXH16141.1 D,D-heptose 1-phosphate adenosyltransferase / D,D-heptose 7-phosphate kinase (cytidylyltransferase-like domain) [Malaciobacter mytili LMG 24559]RXI40511.1 ADP-heptose synthase [Malaciobacter mytili]RXK17041.1 ADP-heptose synthase [Malaciobacter mytili LMG 24559]
MKKALVYGNFNILHPGHLRLLKFAKESADYLIVAVNSNKLTSDPNLFDEKIRLESIQATSFVDEAFILNEDILDYIKRTKPTFVVKGKEHQIEKNKEEEILKSYGGKLLFTSGEIGFSSLDLLNKEFEINDSFIQHEKKYIQRHNIKKDDLVTLINNFSKLNILVIGDTIIDEYITCDPIGMSQEDPTIVVTPLSTKKFIGGASIVAAHAKTLGANVSYISVLGEDENYTFIENYLKNLNISAKLYKDNTRPTTLKQRFRALNKTLLRVNHLKQHYINSDIEKDIIKTIKEFKNLDLIIFSDFSYGILSKTIIEEISLFAQNNNISMVADSQSSSQVGDISKFKNMHIVTPTEREIRLSLNDFESGLVILSSKLKQKSNPKYIFTTLGAEGVMIYNSNKNELLTDNIPALNLNPKDVSGAGDSFLICASMSNTVGANIWQAAYLGSIAAAIQVSRIGNIPIKKDEIIKELNF